MPVLQSPRLRFGPFELDLESAELFKFGQKLRLQGHPVQILFILLEKSGQLVSREELRQKLWPAETATFVDFEHGLNTAIRKLRAALGDEAETPQYIETLPRRGYRFIGQLTGAQPPTADMAQLPDPTVSAIAGHDAKVVEPKEDSFANIAHIASSMADVILRQNRRYRRFVALVAVLFVLLVLALLVARSLWFGPSGPRIVAAKQLTFSGIVGNWMGVTVDSYPSIQSDGRHIYYSVNTPAIEMQLRSVPVGGGPEMRLGSPIPSPVILHISPNGSTLLVKEPVGPRGNTESAIWMLSTDGGSWRKLGDVEAHDAAWAPDGKTIVFAQGRELYLTDLQGNSPAKLASIPGRASWLRWSPDGRELRFTVIDERDSSTLWALGSDGTLRQLLTQWKEAGLVCCGVWTADGRYFLFSNYRNNRFDYWILSERGLPTHREHPTLLSPGGLQITAVAVSPLESKIFVVGFVPSALTTFKLDAGTGRTSPVYPELEARRITFSHDHQFVAYITKTGELWRARSDGTEKLQLTVSPMHVHMAQYSPDGRRIAFMARGDHGSKICWVSSDGGAIHEIASNIVNQADPNWSSDGQSIIFGQVPDFWGGPVGAKRALYRYDLRTEQTSEVPGSEGLFSPRWSPDYRYIAAMSADFQSMSLFDFATGKWRLLVHHNVHNPFWSPDSGSIYFNQASRIWRVRSSDAHLEEIPIHSEGSRCQGFSSSSGFAPDGSILLICIEDSANIYALDWE